MASIACRSVGLTLARQDLRRAGRRSSVVTAQTDGFRGGMPPSVQRRGLLGSALLSATLLMGGRVRAAEIMQLGVAGVGVLPQGVRTPGGWGGGGVIRFPFCPRPDAQAPIHGITFAFVHLFNASHLSRKNSFNSKHKDQEGALKPYRSLCRASAGRMVASFTGMVSFTHTCASAARFPQFGLPIHLIRLSVCYSIPLTMGPSHIPITL